MEQSVDTTERRRLQRFPAIELEAQMKPEKGMLSRWADVEPFDFTRTGLSIATSHSLAPGSVIMLRLRLPLATGDLEVDRVIGVVRNIQAQSDSSPRYGVEFDFNANRHMKKMETVACLGRMEGILDRSEKLRNRLLSQKDVLKDLQP